MQIHLQQTGNDAVARELQEEVIQFREWKEAVDISNTSCSLVFRKRGERARRLFSVLFYSCFVLFCFSDSELSGFVTLFKLTQLIEN